MEYLISPAKLPARPRDGHKGTFGHVLVVGGADGMLGAPVFTGWSALRTGSGLVQLAVPSNLLSHCIGMMPELIGIGLGADTDLPNLVSAAAKATVLAIGPGMGASEPATARVLKLIQLHDKPMVVDADALNVLSGCAEWPRSFVARGVLTPHPGEMKRLARFIGQSQVPSDDAGRLDIAARLAQHTGQIVVLKGARTVVTDGRRTFVNNTGDSSLSKAGTGDVLTGIIASLIGQGMEPFDASTTGVHLHGLAGQLAGRVLGPRSVLAQDMINSIPRAITHLSHLSHRRR